MLVPRAASHIARVESEAPVMSALRFWAVVALLTATVLIVVSRSRSEPKPERQPLTQIPNRIQGWEGIDQTIDSRTLAVLGAGEFLSRVYTQGNNIPPVSLFVGYFPSQRTGVSIHSPKHCLPGSGWVFESSRYVNLVDAERKSHWVGEYTIGNGARKEFVIYWYEAHGRSLASEYAALFYLISDAIRTNRSDGALVRVITPVGPDENMVQAKSRAESFVTRLSPMLPCFIPN
jgi:EpsI family protein